MNNNIRGAKAPVEHLVPNRRLLELLQSLLYHHQTLRKPDPYGVQLYQDAINHYLAYHKLSSGVLGYMLNRIHPKGRFNSYYSKMHMIGEKVKKPHHLIEYFKQRPEELVLSTVGFALSVKEEIKVQIGGSIDGYHDWVLEVVRANQAYLLSTLINRLTVDTKLMDLPKMIKMTLLRAISYYFMNLGNPLEKDDLILLRALLKKHNVLDVYCVFR